MFDAFDMFDNELNEQCLTYLITNMTNKEESSLVYRFSNTTCYEPSSKQRDILTTTQHVARSTTIYMLDDLVSEQCSTCSTTSKANNVRVRHVRQRAKRAIFDMFDNERSEQKKSSLVYRFPKHDFLINCVQLILSLDLLLRLLKLQTLVIK